MRDYWTAERVEKLKKLQLDGMSCSLIASRLGGGATRNSVIGKLHRLGLARGGQNQYPRIHKNTGGGNRRYKRKPNKPFRIVSYRRDPIDAAAVAAAKEELLAILTAPEVDVPVKERRGVAELLDKQCRWPIVDPQHKDFHFCNGQATPGLPYCKFHAARAFVPPDPRRNPNPSPRRTDGASRVIRDSTRALFEFDAMEPA